MRQRGDCKSQRLQGVRLFGLTIPEFQTGTLYELIALILIDVVVERSTSLIKNFTQKKHMFLEIFTKQVKNHGDFPNL